MLYIVSVEIKRFRHDNHSSTAEAIQSAVQSRRTRLSTTNIVLAEVFTANNWENRQVDVFFGLCEIAGIGSPTCEYIIYVREKVVVTRRI